MAKDFTKNSGYKSSYSDSWITAAQYISELMCENMARKNGQVLPYKFWNEYAWKTAFKRQLLLANSLLKLYSAPAIIQAIRSKEGQKIYSLAAPWLDAIIEKFEKVEKKPVEAPTVRKTDGVRPSMPKKGSIWELDDDC